MAYDLSNRGPSAQTLGGLAQGLGGGFSQAMAQRKSRNLWEQLQSRRQAEVERRTLASLGLMEAPQPGQDQYAEYFNQMEMLKNKGQTAQSYGQFVGDDKAADWFLAEDRARGAAAAAAEAGVDPMFAKQLYARYFEAESNVIKAAQEAASGDPLAMETYRKAIADLGAVKADISAAGLKAPVGASSANQLSSAAGTPYQVGDVLGRVQGKAEASNKIVDGIVAEANVDLRQKIGKFKDNLTNVRRNAAFLSSEVAEWDSRATDKAYLTGLIAKLVGLTIEPGLQVTEGEVQLFAGGDTMVKSFIDGMRALGRALGSFWKDGRPSEAAVAASQQNPSQIRSLMTLASRLISSSEEIWIRAIEEKAKDVLEATDIRIQNALKQSNIPQSDRAELLKGANEAIRKLAGIDNLGQPSVPLTDADLPIRGDEYVNEENTAEEEEQEYYYGDPVPKSTEKPTAVNEILTETIQGVAKEGVKQAPGMVARKANPFAKKLEERKAK